LTTLGLGIGAATTMFSVVDAVLFKPLPFDDGDRLVAIEERSLEDPTNGGIGVAYPTYLHLRDGVKSLQHLAAMRFEDVTLRGGADSVREFAAFVSPELFDVLRVRPEVGRTFTADENRPGGGAVIIGAALWKRLLGGTPHPEEQTLLAGAARVRVVGVMPAGFGFPTRDTEIWFPIGELGAAPSMTDPRVHMTSVVGRLSPGATLDAARSELAGLAKSVIDAGHTVSAVPLADDIIGRTREPLMIATAAIGLVLLLASVNTAGLMLARAVARRRETAIRASLGASRGRLVRQHLTESVVLALAGSGVGLLLTAISLDLVQAMLSAIIPRAEGMALNGRVLAFTMVTGFVTSLVFGVVPALSGSRADVSSALKGARPGREGRVRLRTALVVAEIALSLVLVAGAGLMAKSYWRVVNVDPGFDPRGLVLMRVSLPPARYSDVPSVVRFYGELPGRLAGIAGVDAITGVNVLPISGGDSQGGITAEGRIFPPGDAPAASFRRVLPNYFRAMRIPILSGRAFDDRDLGQDPKVVIVSDAMARRLWPGQVAIGRRIKVGPAEREPWLTVVGVAGDVRNVGIETEPAFDTYEPHAQRPWATMRLIVRAGGDGIQVSTAVRARLRAIDADLIVDRVETMASRIGESEQARQFSTALLAVFAGLALILAAVSLYGLTAYSVASRTREFGVRLVLGATSANVARQVVIRSIRLGMAGILLGTVAALPAMWAARSWLAFVEPGDPLVFAGVGCVLFVATLAAAYVPARRATRLDPNIILRVE
jgi:predicted permease